MNRLMIIMILATIFCGCDFEKIEQNQNKQETTLRKTIPIEKIEFEGHTYLIRTEFYPMNYGFGGMCHDENCKCKASNR